MSASTMAWRWQGAMASTTARQFRRAVALALLAVGVGCLLYAGERFFLSPERRFLENPASIMTRAVGLAHFWIGWLFLFTSPRIRSRPALVRLLALTLLGAGLCVLCSLSGSAQHPLVFLFLYGYFLLHEVRDQTMLAQAYGDSPATRPEEQALLAALCRAAALVLVTVLTCGYLVHGTATGKIVLSWPTSAPLLLGGVAILLAASLWASLAALRLGCQVHGNMPALVAAHLPLLLVYAGIGSILLLGAVGGSVVFNLIILIHAAAWLLFISAQLGQRPAPARVAVPSLALRACVSLWTWLRSTPAGFITLHLGLVVLLLVLLGLRVYVWQRVGLVSELLDATSFNYWSLMHITLAFWRGR